MKKILKGILLFAIIGCFTGGCFAWDDEVAGTTDITVYYQQYRDFSFKIGAGDDWRMYDFNPAKMSGGGFSVAHNLAEWFAVWTQLSFFGTVDSSQVPDNTVRIINNLQGIRYQTRKYGPLNLYGKAGAGITWYGFNAFGSGTTFSAGYGGGANVWLNNNIGITLDASHIMMMLPNLTDMDNREKVDSGMAYTTGITFRF
jgi:hypothetical protein